MYKIKQYIRFTLVFTILLLTFSGANAVSDSEPDNSKYTPKPPPSRTVSYNKPKTPKQVPERSKSDLPKSSSESQKDESYESFKKMMQDNREKERKKEKEKQEKERIAKLKEEGKTEQQRLKAPHLIKQYTEEYKKMTHEERVKEMKNLREQLAKEKDFPDVFVGDNTELKLKAMEAVMKTKSTQKPYEKPSLMGKSNKGFLNGLFK